MSKVAVRERSDLRSRTVIKPVVSLSEAEYRECRELTFHGAHRGSSDPSTGLMQERLDRSRRSDAEAQAVMLKDVGGTIVGWGLVFRPFYPRSKGPNYDIYMFVHPDARRMGIGSRIYRSARRRFGPMKSHPWDNRSRGFFSTVEG